MDLLKRAFRIPLRIPFRGIDHRAGLLVRGDAGWGEISPFDDYDAERKRLWVDGAMDHARNPFPSACRDRVPVNVTVPAIAPEEAHALVASSGCFTAKVKVGEEGDEARLEAVRAALGPSGKLRIDVNGAWDIDGAERWLRSYARFDLEYAEQPVASVEDLSILRRRVEVPVAADESIRIGDPQRVRDLEAADIAILKVHPLGGIRRSLEIAEMLGLPCVVSSALETSIGIAAGLALAAALPELEHACGLGTVALLQGDVVADPLLPVDGFIEVRRPQVDDAALARWEPPGSVTGTITNTAGPAAFREIDDD